MVDRGRSNAVVVRVKVPASGKTLCTLVYWRMAKIAREARASALRNLKWVQPAGKWKKRQTYKGSPWYKYS